MANQTLSSRLNVGVAQIVVPGTSSGLVAAAGLPGNTTGSAIASGYVGEYVTTASAIATTALGTSETDITNATFTLSAGLWRIEYGLCVQVATGSVSGNNAYCSTFITDSSNNHIGKSERLVSAYTTAASAVTVNSATNASSIVQPTTSTTYKLRGIRVDGAGTNTASVIVDGGSPQKYNATFFATRIA